MDLVALSFCLLFGLAFICQIVAISVRRIFLSLFFSFLYSVAIALILIAMGHQWLAMVSLWQTSCLSYYALVKTSLLLGSHKTPRPERRITFSLIAFIVIASAFAAVIALLMPLLQHNVNLPVGSFDHAVRAIVAGEYGLVTLTLVLTSLAAFISVYVLVRRDDVMERI